MTKTTQYFTTPIFYVNGSPHIGHAYTTFLADLYSRYSRLLGKDTFFITGTDEHGQKVEQSAKEQKITPLELADKNSALFSELSNTLNFSNDDFIRTTEQRHKAVVEYLLQRLYEEGDIYKKDYEGFYCIPCEIFLTQKEVSEEEKCPHCDREVNYITESNYFFRMSKYADWLIEYIKSNDTFILPKHRAKETLGFLEKGLNDLCISRPKSRVSWGIDLPFDSEYVTYVWFDALANYLTCIGYPESEMFSQYWPPTCQFIGKDILTTHTVYWTTILKSLELPMPKTIFAHGWWLAEERKMSKSFNNVIDPLEIVGKYGVDAFRYYLITAMTPGQDSSFSESNFISVYNADLANDVGNILNRIVKMIDTNFNGKIPSPHELSKTNLDENLRSNILSLAQSVETRYESKELHLLVSEIAAGFRLVNKYLNDRKPWSLTNDPNELGLILYYALEAYRILTALLYPVMPQKIKECRNVVGYHEDLEDFQLIKKWGVLNDSIQVMKSEQPLFPRIEQQKIVASSEEAETSLPSAESKLITIKEFQQSQLRTGKIISVEKIKGSVKLFKLTVNTGEKTQTIISGLAKSYDQQMLVGKNVIVLINLQPTVILGVKSEGMLLCASDDQTIKVLTTDGELPPGSKVS